LFRRTIIKHRAARPAGEGLNQMKPPEPTTIFDS